MIITAVSCSVYDASLLESGPAAGGSGGTNETGGRAGSAGEDSAGRSGSSTGANGGSSGSTSGEAGTNDMAGAMEFGGDTGEAGNAGGSATAGGAGGTGGGTGGTAGVGGSSSAGSAGTAGVGGSAGIAGSVGGAGAAGSAGSAGSAGAGGSPGVTGCAKLSLAMDDASDRAHFVISLASATDLTSTTTGIVSMRVYVQAGAAGTIFNYVQDSQFRYLGVTTASRPALKSLSGWQTLTFNVGQTSGSSGIAKNDIRRIGIEINAAPDTAGWSNPTVVYVDSISVVSPALSFPFDSSASVNSTAGNTDLSNQVMWQHNGSSDTTATNVALSWVQTCP